MRADWTRPDPRIAKLLSVYHRYGIPLYVVYGPGSPLGEALPEIITPGAVTAALDTVDGSSPVGAMMLLDVLEHLLQPQELLAELSRWSLAHGEPLLVVSVPNVSHFDVAFRLLCGKWIPTETGLLDSTHIRFFTEELLTNLVHRTGWEIVARDNFATLRTDQYDTPLADAMPINPPAAKRFAGTA